MNAPSFCEVYKRYFPQSTAQCWRCRQLCGRARDWRRWCLSSFRPVIMVSHLRIGLAITHRVRVIFFPCVETVSLVSGAFTIFATKGQSCAFKTMIEFSATSKVSLLGLDHSRVNYSHHFLMCTLATNYDEYSYYYHHFYYFY